MTFSVIIQPLEANQTYRLVDPQTGYKIDSQIDLSGEVSKIQKILAAYVELSIARANMTQREQKFKSHHSESGESQIYDFALDRLSKAQQSLTSIKNKYQVVDIKTFAYLT